LDVSPLPIIESWDLGQRLTLLQMVQQHGQALFRLSLKDKVRVRDAFQALFGYSGSMGTSEYDAAGCHGFGHFSEFSNLTENLGIEPNPYQERMRALYGLSDLEILHLEGVGIKKGRRGSVSSQGGGQIEQIEGRIDLLRYLVDIGASGVDE